jgi:hypothetical protein
MLRGRAARALLRQRDDDALTRQVVRNGLRAGRLGSNDATSRVRAAAVCAGRSSSVAEASRSSSCNSICSKRPLCAPSCCRKLSAAVSRSQASDARSGLRCSKEPPAPGRDGLCLHTLGALRQDHRVAAEIGGQRFRIFTWRKKYVRRQSQRQNFIPPKSDARLVADFTNRCRAASRPRPLARPQKAAALQPFRELPPDHHAQITCKRLPRRQRRQNRWPLSGSPCSTSCTCRAKHG